MDASVLGLGSGTERVLYWGIPIYTLMGESILDCLASSHVLELCGPDRRNYAPIGTRWQALNSMEAGSRLRYGYTGFSDCGKEWEMGTSRCEPHCQCSAKSHGSPWLWGAGCGNWKRLVSLATDWSPQSVSLENSLHH